MNPCRSCRTWMLGLVGAVTLAGAAVAVSQNGTAPQLHEERQTAEDLSKMFRAVARDVLPAVVAIETSTKPQPVVRGDGNGASPDMEMFRRFFGDDPRFEQFRQFEDFDQFQAPRRRSQGAGSGFVIDSDGVILTNSHVVEGADEVRVTLNDGREFDATEWNIDPRSDVAIVRIETDERLPALPLGDSNKVEIGDWVVAVGNSFGIGNTVTQGIISAKGRGMGINERENYLQTDAAINPGNSGGPLVNLNGEVVGINTAISTRSGGYDGVGFAIPVNMARWVSEQLVEHGEVRRAYLGVMLQELTPELRDQLGTPHNQGTLVAQVMPETPASKAGFEPGDVVLSFAGTEVRRMSQLPDIVERLEIGETYEAVVQRGGETVELDVTMEQMPGDFTPAMQRLSNSKNGQSDSGKQFDELGLQVQSLNDALRNQLQLEDDVEGVLVAKVDSGSPAAAAGISSGDVIEKVASQRVTTAEEFAAAVESVDVDQGVLMLVRRGSSSRFVVVER